MSLLAAGSLPVRMIAGHFPSISRPAVSKHLRILREGGLVSEQRSGRERYYSLDRGTVAETLDWMESVNSQVAKASRVAGATTRLPGTVARAKASPARPAKIRPAKIKKTSGPKPAAGSTRPEAQAKGPRSRGPTPKAKSFRAAEEAEPGPATDESTDSSDWKSW